MPPRDIEVRTDDGCALDATLYEPEPPNGIALQINSAAVTPRRYYAAFAEDMAKRGFVVLTYDYRDVHQTDPQALRKSIACMSVWGERDQAAVTRYLRAAYPAHALVLVAHSMGGQFVGFSSAVRELSAVLMVAVAHGPWLRYRGYRRWRRALNLHLLWPIALRIGGYLPAFLMGGARRAGRVTTIAAIT